MNYPTIMDYIDAIEGGGEFFRTLAAPRLCADNYGEPIYSSGNFGVVFNVRIANRDRALKCFTRPQQGRSEAYAILERELPRSEYIIDYRYLVDEISIINSQGVLQPFEVVDMEWVDGRSLLSVLIEAAQYSDRKVLSLLSEKFDKMALWLLSSGIAHGDLKPENIIVTSSLDLRLVDYDGFYLPSMSGQAQREYGTAAYQHPLRSAMRFGVAIDHYSIGMLSFTLRTLAQIPELYDLYGNIAGALLFDPGQLMAGRSDAFDFVGSSVFASTRLYALLASATPELDGLLEALGEPLPDANVALIPFQVNDKWGFSDMNSNVISPIYDQVLPFSQARAAVCFMGKWGYIDTLGNVVGSFRFDNAWSFSEDLALVCGSGKYGFVGRTGRMVIGLRYEFARSFSEGYAVVRVNGKYGYINYRGWFKFKAVYDYAENIHDGQARVEQFGRQFLIYLDDAGG